MNYVYQGSPNESSEVQRSGLHQLLGELQAGDCLAVTSLSGVADSSASLLELLDDLKQRGIRFRSVEEGLDTGTPEGQTAVALLRAAPQRDASPLKLTRSCSTKSWNAGKTAKLPPVRPWQS